MASPEIETICQENVVKVTLWVALTGTKFKEYVLPRNQNFYAFKKLVLSQHDKSCGNIKLLLKEQEIDYSLTPDQLLMENEVDITMVREEEYLIASVLSLNSELCIWDINREKRIHTFDGTNITYHKITHDKLFITTKRPNSLKIYSKDWTLFASEDVTDIITWFDVFDNQILILYLSGRLELRNLTDSGIPIINVFREIDLDEYDIVPVGTCVRYQCEFSENGSLVVAITYNNNLKIWDTATSELRYYFKIDEYMINFAISPNGKLVAIGTVNGLVKICSIDGRIKFYQLRVRNMVNILAFSPDGSMLVVGSHSDRLHFIQFDHNIAAHPNPSAKVIECSINYKISFIENSKEDVVINAGFSPSGEQLWTISRDMIHIYNIRNLIRGISSQLEDSEMSDFLTKSDNSSVFFDNSREPCLVNQSIYTKDTLTNFEPYMTINRSCNKIFFKCSISQMKKLQI
jgi:WD40 repeat protein